MVMVPQGQRKCGSIKIVHCQLKRKRQTIDRLKKKHCALILKMLMTHETGWVFNQPVDPEALNIPDYFDIITAPMDLGTVKSKLETELYSDVNEFADDVRLTFSNAMRYNPPANPVHIMAKELNSLFLRGWKSLEAKWKDEEVQNLQIRMSEKAKKSSNSNKQIYAADSTLSGKLIVSEKKQKSQKSLPSSLEGKMQKHGQVVSITSAAHVSQKSSVPAVNSRSADGVKASSNDSQRRVQKESSIRCEQVLNSDPLACNSGKPRIKVKNNSTDSDNVTTTHSVAECDNPSYQPSTPDSDWGDGFVDLRSRYHIYDEQMSPSKALRAAMLKKRFADTILKAQQKTLLDNGTKGDLMKMQKEKEKLERQQQEEKARIEAQIRAAEAAAREKAETEKRIKREREREAARLALQKMEKTVEIDENNDILRELEMFGYSQPNGLDALLTSPFSNLDGFLGNPLRQLGLFIKDEGLEDEDACVDMEEGEICC